MTESTQVCSSCGGTGAKDDGPNLRTCRYCNGTGKVAVIDGRVVRTIPKSELKRPPAPRQTWDEYFLSLAHSVASRATCPRKQVGAVIVRDKMIVSTGYNGAIRGLPHCTEVGCDMENDHCVAVIHAEANAIVQAARNGVRIDGAECYVTISPCWTCFKMLANAGIKRIVYGEFYRDERIFEAAEQLGIELVHLQDVS